MSKGWEVKKLGDFYRVGSSKRVLKSQWKTSGVPFYRGREVTRLAAEGFVENELFISEDHFVELSKAYGVPKAGDIVITAIGTIGNSHVVRSSDRFYFKDASVLWMKRTAEVSSEFVNLWLKSPSFFGQLDRGNGATVDTLTIQKLESVQIGIPPLAEQQRIVGLLDEAFAGLATAQANAAQNLQNARELFDSRLELTITEGGRAWGEKRLCDLCCIARGGSPRPIKDYLTNRAEGINWIKIGDATASGKYIYRTEEKILPAGKSRSRVVNPGDFLLSNSMSFGRPYIMKTSGCIHDGWLVLSGYSQELNQDYLYHVLGSKYVYRQFDRLAAGSTVRNLNIDAAGRAVIPVPPLKEQEALSLRLDALSDETQRLAAIYEQKLAALAELKKSLLHQAFAGEL